MITMNDNRQENYMVMKKNTEFRGYSLTIEIVNPKSVRAMSFSIPSAFAHELGKKLQEIFAPKIESSFKMEGEL